MKLILLIFTLIFSNLTVGTLASDQLFYCADFSCQEPISTGKTLLVYSAKTAKHLSFKKNEDIKILSKPDDPNGADWIGFVNGKVGLVPKDTVREYKMHKYDTKLRYPFDKLPVWGPKMELRELQENYQEVDDKPSNTPPILDIDPGTAPSKDAELKEDAAVESKPKAESVPAPKSVDPVEQKATPPEAQPEPVKEVVSNNVEQEPQQEASAAKEQVPEEQAKAKVPKEPTKVESVIPAKAEEPQEDSKPLKEETVVEAPPTEQKPKQEPETVLAPESHPPAAENSAKKVEEVDEEPLAESAEELDDPEDEDSGIDEDAEDSSETENEIADAQPQQAKETSAEPKAEPEKTETVEPQKNEQVVEPPKVEQSGDAVESSATETTETPQIESTTASIFDAVKGFTSSVMNFLPEDLRDGGEASGTVGASDVPEQVTMQPLQEAQENVSQQPTVIKATTEEKSSEVSAQPKVPPAAEAVKEEKKVEESSTSEEPITTTTSIPKDLAVEPSGGTTKPEEPATTEPTKPAAEPVETTPIETTTVETPAEAVPPTAVPTAVPIEIPAIEPQVEDALPLTASPAPSESPVTESTPVPESEAFKVVVTETNQPVEEVPEVSVTPKPELPPETLPPVIEVPAIPEIPPTEATIIEAQEQTPEPDHHHHEHDHSDHHHHGHDHSHHHHHHHGKYGERDESKEDSSWSIILVVKHLSGTLLSLLPEHLQDSILDVDSALVFTGIIALMLVSICVPYFVIESILAVRPLKKQVVELNKSLWKVSAAYENQQEEFDTYKKKALAYDEDQKRIEQLEMELQILKKLEAKQKEQVKLLQKQLKTSAKAADGIEHLIEASMKEKEIAIEERNKLQLSYAALQETLKEKLEELENAQASGSALALDLEVVNHEKENLAKRLATLETELELVKTKLSSETEIRRKTVEENDALTKERDSLQTELLDLRRVLHQYEESVSNMTDELTAKENELQALKETLGEDSPLIDISEAKAKLKSAEEEAASLKSRCETVAFENASLTKTLEETKAELESVRVKKEEAENNLKVLEGYFRKKEEDLRTAVAKLELEQQIKHKDKDELIKMIREKESEIQLLISTNEGLKQEIEDMKGAHRNDLRQLESKVDEHWLSLCQTERKYAEARKECELLRQKLVALVKEKEGGDEDRMSAIGDVPLFSLPPEMVPPPIDDLAPPLPPMSYFPLDDDFNPPPPLPLDSEPMRPPPLGRLSPTSQHNNYSSYLDDDDPISPIGRGSVGGRGDYSGESSGSDSPDHRRPGSRDNWMNNNNDNRSNPPNRRRRAHPPHQHHPTGNGPKTSSPLPHGVNC